MWSHALTDDDTRVYMPMNIVQKKNKKNKQVYIDGLVPMHIDHHGPLLLTWFNFNPSMDK